MTLVEPQTYITGPPTNDTISVPPRIDDVIAGAGNSGLWTPSDRYKHDIHWSQVWTLDWYSWLFYVDQHGPGLACDDPNGYCDPQGTGLHLIAHAEDGSNFETCALTLTPTRPDDGHGSAGWYGFQNVPCGLRLVGPISWRIGIFNANPIQRPGLPPVDPTAHTGHVKLWWSGLWYIEAKALHATDVQGL